MADEPQTKVSLTGGKAVSTTGDSRTEDGRPGNIGRRSVLRLGAAAGAVGLFGSMASLASAADVDVVDEGADPTGEEPVNDVFERLAAEGATVTVPEGTYRVQGDLELRGDGFSFRGTNATLLLADGVTLSGRNWTFEGFEFDFSPQDGFGTIRPKGADWTLGNVVCREVAQVSEKQTMLWPEVTSGEGVVHDFYVPEVVTDGDSAGKPKFMFASGDINGKLTLRRLWLQNWAENTLYLTECPDAHVVFESCYLYNTNVGLRVSGRTEVRNCLFHADGPVPGQWNEERKTDTGWMKGVWVNANRVDPGDGGPVLIEDCDFHFQDARQVENGVELDGPLDGTVMVRNNRFHMGGTNRYGVKFDTDGIPFDSGGNRWSGLAKMDSRVEGQSVDGVATDPSLPLPEPPERGTTPGEGSSGGTAPDGGSDAPENGDGTDRSTIRIEGDGDGSTGAVFEFEVSGDLETLTPEEPVSQPGHGVDGSSVREDVWSEFEEYRYTGDITRFTLDGPATVDIDGRTASTIRIEGDGDSSTGAVFEFEVNGDLVPMTPEEEVGQEGHGVDGSFVREDVWSGHEQYLFTGNVTSFSLDGPATVSVDGSKVDPADLDDSTDKSVAPPTVDRYVVQEAGSKNPHANILVSWDVSSAESELTAARIDVVGPDGNVVDSSETALSGSAHSDAEYFEIRDVVDQTFDVELTVENDAGKTATASQSVTE